MSNTNTSAQQTLLNLLPQNPDFDSACDMIDSDDQAIWQPIIHAICEKHQIEVTPFTCINGWANGIFALQNNLLIKIVPPNWGFQGSCEIEALTLLAEHDLSVAIPRIKASDNINGWFYIIMDKLPGTSLHAIWNDVPEDNKILLATQVAQFALTLNQLPLAEKASADGELVRPWAEFLVEQKENCYEKRQKQGLSEPLLADLTPFLNRVNYQPRTDLFNQGKVCLMHTDLHPGNLLVEKVAGHWQLSGVIDFGDAIIGEDTYYELGSPTLFMGQGNKTINRAIINSYGLSIDVNEQVAFQQHSTALCLLRHSGEMNYPLKQVPGCETLTDWQSISERFFAL